jgi:hypothetical protein
MNREELIEERAKEYKAFTVSMKTARLVATEQIDWFLSHRTKKGSEA